MKRQLSLAFISLCLVNLLSAQSTSEYKSFDFIPGEKTIFEDNLQTDKSDLPPAGWTVEGGKASVISFGEEKVISILEYYTKMSPKLPVGSKLPDAFTIEYDTWLDHGYDGNPGIEIHLMNGNQEAVITPNKHELTVSCPNDVRQAKDNPEAYFGENKFYDRWVHISIGYSKKHLTVYLDQYKQIDLADCQVAPDKVVVTGNTSQDMKILLKNFRLAESLQDKAVKLTNGKFVTHAIKFDVNKWVIKAESMGAINELVSFLKANPASVFEIGGHTDSDGDDASNLTLSDHRAQAVKELLVSLGVKESQLQTKGYGESAPIDKNTTPEGRGNNRRVEFVKIN